MPPVLSVAELPVQPAAGPGGAAEVVGTAYRLSRQGPVPDVATVPGWSESASVQRHREGRDRPAPVRRQAGRAGAAARTQAPRWRNRRIVPGEIVRRGCG